MIETVLPESFAVFQGCTFPVLFLKKVVSNILHIFGDRQNLVRLKGRTGQSEIGNFDRIFLYFLPFLQLTITPRTRRHY